jgi:hypothetical protein
MCTLLPISLDFPLLDLRLPRHLGEPSLIQLHEGEHR